MLCKINFSVDFTNELEKFSCHTFPEFVHNSVSINVLSNVHISNYICIFLNFSNNCINKQDNYV